MVLRIMAALAATALLAGCGAGETYPLSAKEVRSRLLNLKPPMFVFGSSGVEAMTSQIGQDQVRWTLVNDGKPLMRFTATVTPDGEKSTNVALSVEPAEGKTDTQIGRNMSSNPSTVKLYETAMIEQIDARLENRSFNMGAIQGQMMTAAVANMGQMQTSLAEAAHQTDTMMKKTQADMADAEAEAESRAAIDGYSEE
jgi:hypothetical protein